MVPVIVLTSFDATITSLCPHSKFLRWDLFVNLITHKQTQVYTLVTENWTWSFSPSTCRITACALLVSRFAWTTIKQTNKQFIINNKNKTKQKNSVISYKPGHFFCFKVRWSAKPQWLQIWRGFFILVQIKLILWQKHCT